MEANNAPPRPATQNADDVLRELKASGHTPSRQRQIVKTNLWRLRPEEVGWLNEAGLTDVTPEVAELMAKGWSEAAAREAVAVRHGELGGDSGRE